jgi:hypothetical protein
MQILVLFGKQGEFDFKFWAVDKQVREPLVWLLKDLPEECYGNRAKHAKQSASETELLIYLL